jgi:TonB family protein
MFRKALFTFIVISLTAATATSAQQSGPLRKSDLVRMLAANTYTATEVVHIVRLSCISFQPTDRDREDLERLAGPELLEVIDNCRNNAFKGYRNGMPTAEKVVLSERPSVPSTDVEVDPQGIADLGEIPGLKSVILARPELEAPKLKPTVEAETIGVGDVERPPRIQNMREVGRRLLQIYRPHERHAGVVVVRLHVDADGTISAPEIYRSSGDAELDNAVLRVVPEMEFEPATSRDRKVASWTLQPIVLATPDA